MHHNPSNIVKVNKFYIIHIPLPISGFQIFILMIYLFGAKLKKIKRKRKNNVAKKYPQLINIFFN